MSLSSSAAPRGYRLWRIAPHGLVFVLVAFLFVTGDNMTDVFKAIHRNGASAWSPIWVPIHIKAGLVVLAAMIWRLMPHRRFGAPPPPAEEPQPPRLLALGFHGLLHLDLAPAPLVGLAAFFLAPGLAGAQHFLVRAPILVLVGLHIAGAPWNTFVSPGSVLNRMPRPI